MNKEIQSIIRRIENVNTGQPWYGRPVYTLLEETDLKKVYLKPARPGGGPCNTEHSMIELLYHMITWADFTLNRIQLNGKDMKAFEKTDWREINPKIHTWKMGLAEFKGIHKKIITLLKKKDDTFLKEIVDERKYNYRFLLNGFIEHNIYHIGQIAYLNKLL